MKKVLMLLSVFLFVSCNQEDLEKQVNQTNREIFTLGDISISENARSLSNNDHVITFIKYDGKPGLSINITKMNHERFSIDYDKNGITDFHIKLLSNNHILYEDVNFNPLKEIVMKSENNKYYMDVVKIYNPQSRALWGNGKETIRECFERRMSSAEGILMIATGGCIANGLGALAVCAGGALSCVLYNPF